MSAQFQVLAFDYPGFGMSSHTWLYPDELEEDYFGFRIDWACYVLVELGIEACHVLGTGIGALAALYFAGRQAALRRLHPLSQVVDSFYADFNIRTFHRWLDVREHFYVRNVHHMEAWHGSYWRTLVEADTCFLRGQSDWGGYDVTDKYINAISCPILLAGHLQDPALPNLAREYAHE